MKEKIYREETESIERNLNIQTEKSENKKYSYIIYSYLILRLCSVFSLCSELNYKSVFTSVSLLII